MRRLKLKKWTMIAIVVAVVGLVLTGLTYFNTNTSAGDVAVVTKMSEKITQKTVDEYKNNDELWQQQLTVKLLSGDKAGKRYRVRNTYVKSQAVTMRYKPQQRVFVEFHKGAPRIRDAKRDWVIVLGLTIMLAMMAFLIGKKSMVIALSMLLNIILFYFVIKLDIVNNGTLVITLYSIASILFAFLSLVLIQGFHKKMWLTLASTLAGVFIAFALSYLVMHLTHESGIKYEAVEYATQDPRSLFLAQAILGVLGAVMDESTDIISSLSELIYHKPDSSFKDIWQSGRTIGQEIMGPLINVLVLIFMAEALPMTILYLRDNNTIAYTFEFALSLGILQSLISAIGIALTVPISTLFGALMGKKGGARS